jgi:hypothetical protein
MLSIKKFSVITNPKIKIAYPHNSEISTFSTISVLNISSFRASPREE